jgi:hypothetical protein
MGLRLPVLLPVAAVLALSAAAVTFAAQGGAPVPAPAATAAEPVRKEIVVPDVRRQAYVFAKGILEEGGFAWKVQGGVEGFAANTVLSQHPLPGTKILDTGTPLITLTLARNAKYKQQGAPENASAYPGTAVVLMDSAHARVPAMKKTAPARKPTPVAKPKSTPKKKAAPAEKRVPAFTVPGAPTEPHDEMPLLNRVRKLDAWLTKHPKVSPANVDHWLYQHNWIVTGARFGWWRGADALRELIRVDRRVQKLWGVGGRSEQVAQKALSEVEARGA